jgi:hypothetical protein
MTADDERTTNQIMNDRMRGVVRETADAAQDDGDQPDERTPNQIMNDRLRAHAPRAPTALLERKTDA